MMFKFMLLFLRLTFAASHRSSADEIALQPHVVENIESTSLSFDGLRISGFVYEVDNQTQVHAGSTEEVESSKAFEGLEITNELEILKWALEETRHKVTSSFLWGTGVIFFLMFIIPFSLIYWLSWKGRGVLLVICILYITADYHSQLATATEAQSQGWSEPLHSYLGFMMAKYPTHMFGVTNSFWNDYVFCQTNYLIIVPYSYFLTLVRSFSFNPATWRFIFQEFSVVSDEHVVDYFFRTPAYRAASFDEDTNSWLVGTRGYETVGTWANVPGLNATVTKDGNLTSINDRNGNVITPECNSWGLAKQLFWNGMLGDVFNHWHIATHFQFSYVYGAQAVIPKEHTLRKVLDVHNRYHATIDFAAVQSPFAQVVTINRPFDVELGEHTTPTFGESNDTEWNYSLLGLTRGRTDTTGYVFGNALSPRTITDNVMHAASDHWESKTFPPEYAREDSPQMHTPFGPYIRDQYNCFHEFVADLSSEENWFDDADVLKFFEISASVDQAVAERVHSDADRAHMIAMILFENSFIHSVDHRQIYNAYEDLSSWSWHHHGPESLAFPECSDDTPVKKILGTKTWMDWVRQHTFLESFIDWHPWANLVISDDDFMMRTEYGFQESHQKRLRSRMRECLTNNHESEKHQEIVQSLRHDLEEFSTSIEW